MLAEQGQQQRAALAAPPHRHQSLGQHLGPVADEQIAGRGARRKPSQPLERSGRLDDAVGRDGVHRQQAGVRCPNEAHRVVRRHEQRRRVDIRIGEHRHLPTGDRQHGARARARVIGRHQHRDGAGEHLRFVEVEREIDAAGVEHDAHRLDRGLGGLRVGGVDHGLAARALIDDTLRSLEQTRFVETHERDARREHGSRCVERAVVERRVHAERVERGAGLLALALFCGTHELDELVATDGRTIETLTVQVAFDDELAVQVAGEHRRCPLDVGARSLGVSHERVSGDEPRRVGERSDRRRVEAAL